MKKLALFLAPILLLGEICFAGNSLLLVRRRFDSVGGSNQATSYTSIGTLTGVAGYVSYSLSNTAGTLVLAAGATGSETAVEYLTPTGAPGTANKVVIPVRLGRGQVSIKALDSTISAGDLQIDVLAP